MGIITQDKVVLMNQPLGKPGGVGTGLSPLSIDRHGMTGKTDNTIPGRGQTYGRDGWGRFRIKVSYKETPGGLLTGTIEYEKTNEIDFLEKRAKDEGEFGIWEMYAPCARLDNPFGWINGGRLDYYGRMFITGANFGDAPSREATGEPVVTNMPVSWEYSLTFLPLAISSLTWANAENLTNLNDIAGLSEANPGNCIKGYQGPDEHFYIATDAADASTEANVLYSANGGGAIAETSADPFDVGENISQIVARLTTEKMRVIAANGTALTVPAEAQVAYSDVLFGAEATTVWTIVSLTGSTNDDVIAAMEWLFYNRIYASVGVAASEGEIWVSGDQGESWTEEFTGSTQITAFAKGFGEDCKDVYAVGASNLILRERNHSGTFETLVGPSGGATFHSIAIANDTLIFAGNAQSLYVSNNEALNTGGWTVLKDFGSNHTVEEIFLPEGDSNHIYCVVNDTTPGNGEFWHSNDGGNSWNQLTEVTNLGYNAGYAAVEDNNLYIIVGDINATPNGVIHKVSPSQSGC